MSQTEHIWEHCSSHCGGSNQHGKRSYCSSSYFNSASYRVSSIPASVIIRDTQPRSGLAGPQCYNKICWFSCSIFVAGKQKNQSSNSYWFYWWPADKPPLLVNHHTNQTLVYAGVQLCCSVLLAVRAHTVVIIY